MRSKPEIPRLDVVVHHFIEKGSDPLCRFQSFDKRIRLGCQRAPADPLDRPATALEDVRVVRDLVAGIVAFVEPDDKACLRLGVLAQVVVVDIPKKLASAAQKMPKFPDFVPRPAL